MSRNSARAGIGFALCAALALASPPLRGQVSSGGGETAPSRLSDWLLAQPASPNAYPLGLSWRVPGETVAQSALRFALLQSLAALERAGKVDVLAASRLRAWLRSLPVTGRVGVAVADPRWLQANPARDPVLAPGHSVLLPERPDSVTVITAQGERCAVEHTPGREARAYLEACSPEAAGRIDWAWIAQPDGRVQRYGVAGWNAEVQDEPAPGAWLWGPPRDAGWPEPVSEQLIRFLATQGPGAEAPGALLRLPARAGGAPSLRPSRNREVTASDWGGVGLLQTPTARMADAGTFAFHYSRTQPYGHGNIFLQPFDWLEAGFRYTNVSNRLYDPTRVISDDQSYKDKSIDVKFRLWSESAYLPALAVGLRDVAGTGLFSGEYVVASKRSGDFDWSLGLGWGYTGARGNLRNPLGRLRRTFDTRTKDVGQGGSFGFGSFFRGPAALFGGVQYQSPWAPLIFKLEYDGNDYQHEPQGNIQRQRSPWNFGLVYRAGRAVDVTLGVERGTTLMFGLTLHTQLDGTAMLKVNDPPRVPVARLRPAPAPAQNWPATSGEIAVQTGWHVGRIEQLGRELHVTIDDAEAFYWRERIDRVVAVLHRDAPANVDRFVLGYRQRGVEVAEHVVERDAWVAERTQPLPPHARREAVIGRAPDRPARLADLGARPDHVRPRSAGAEARPAYRHTRPAFEAGLSFDYQQTLGGPDGFILYQISAVERARLRLREDTWLQGTLRLGLLDNYQRFRYTAPSKLPRVRTFLREYLTSSILTLPNLQLTHVGRLSDNQYYSAYGGYLESMFAGVGGEWLYRPYASRTAIGVDVNAVRQRAFEQAFSLRDYRVLTGHATLYWDTGWQDVQARISAGRYLAKDFGATLELSRVFKNGVTLGAFATKTNVSAAQFGEGSFDKGIYVSIPFDAMLTRSNSTIANFVWKPLTRDGGAMLARTNQLYNLTSVRNDRTLWYAPASPPNDAVIPADRREAWSPKPPAVPPPYLQLAPRPTAAQWHDDTAEGEPAAAGGRTPTAAGGPSTTAGGPSTTAGGMYEHRLIEALYAQGFRNIRVAFDDARRLSVTLSNEGARWISRAVGRAARTALRLAPLETRELHVTFATGTHPVVRYEFIDLGRLDRYYKGEIGQQALANTVAVRYVDPAARTDDPLAAFARFDDLSTQADPLTLDDVPGYRTLGRVAGDFADAARLAARADWLQAGALGAGLAIASSVFDRRADRFAKDHAGNRLVKGTTRLGDALPWIGMGAAALAALDASDPQRSRTGYAAMEAGASAYLAATGLKYALGRARPTEGAGPRSFTPLSSTRDAFPSRHTAVAWALATPFALEYDAPWLYGIAAISNLARAGSREHWVSDTVAGSLVGYGLGRLFWEASRAPAKGRPRVMLEPSGVTLAWELQ